MGLRYLRRAGSGISSEGAGRRSSVNCGVIERMERVRNSSRWTAILEKDCAADLSTRIDAVRFDLNENLDGETGMLMSGDTISTLLGVGESVISGSFSFREGDRG